MAYCYVYFEKLVMMVSYLILQSEGADSFIACPSVLIGALKVKV